jgi:heat shock protein HslJ
MILALSAAACQAGLSGGDELAGTSWRLVSFDGTPPISGTAPTLVFEDGQVSGNASCNSFGGEYRARAGQIEFGEMFWTLMACLDNGVMDQEQMYMRMLGGAAEYELSAGQLRIMNQQGETLVFEQTDPAE